MIVEKTKNFNDIKKILFDPEIYERIKISDDMPTLPTDNVDYVAGYHEGEIIALMVYYKRNDFTTCHVHVLKTHRAHLAVKFGREALKMRCDNVLYTNIPKKYTKVIRFAEYFGFCHLGNQKYMAVF